MPSDPHDHVTAAMTEKRLDSRIWESELAHLDENQPSLLEDRGPYSKHLEPPIARRDGERRSRMTNDPAKRSLSERRRQGG